MSLIKPIAVGAGLIAAAAVAGKVEGDHANRNVFTPRSSSAAIADGVAGAMIGASAGGALTAVFTAMLFGKNVGRNAMIGGLVSAAYLATVMGVANVNHRPATA